LGGEPSYVPVTPEGAEWNVTAVGPTKLNYAYAFADALIKSSLPHAVTFFSPGKSYPGEINPRWAVHVLWKRDGSYFSKKRTTQGAPRGLAALKRALAKDLAVRDRWIRAFDPVNEK